MILFNHYLYNLQITIHNIQYPEVTKCQHLLLNTGSLPFLSFSEILLTQQLTAKTVGFRLLKQSVFWDKSRMSTEILNSFNNLIRTR